MADPETILQELREFRRENFENLKEIQDDIKKTKNRIDDARGGRMSGSTEGRKERAEGNAQSMTTFVETLLREKLELSPSFGLKIERAHQALVSQPPKDSPPRSIVMKLQSYQSKELIKIAWQKKNFMYKGRKVFLDHDYAPEILRKCKDYMEAKTALRAKNIHFETPFPAKLRVFYEGETSIYNTAEEATKDMVVRGLQVELFLVDPKKMTVHKTKIL